MNIEYYTWIIAEYTSEQLHADAEWFAKNYPHRTELIDAIHAELELRKLFNLKR